MFWLVIGSAAHLLFYPLKYMRCTLSKNIYAVLILAGMQLSNITASISLINEFYLTTKYIYPIINASFCG